AEHAHLRGPAGRRLRGAGLGNARGQEARVTSSLRIVVSGLLGAYPLGGMAWHYLQYVLGLARLGHEVYYLEDSGRHPYNPGEEDSTADPTPSVRYLAGLMHSFDLADRWAYRAHEQGPWFGLADGDREEVLRSAD